MGDGCRGAPVPRDGVNELSPGDEHPHEPGESSAWSETWEWRLVLDDGSLALVVALVRRPAEAAMSYVCALMGRGRPTVAVVEHDIVLPRRDSLELRASGIWADHICETPFSHWNLGLEAFGLTVDHPDDAIGDGRGVRTPVGLDVEWEDDAPPVQLDVGDGYLAAGRAHGEILVGDEVHDVVGAGQRLHRWGTGHRHLGWWGRGLDVGVDGSLHSAPVASAAADDGIGTVVDWTLGVDLDGSPGPPTVWSALRSGT